VSSNLRILRDPRGWSSGPGPVGVTIGNFDGVHTGHQEVIRQLKALVEEAAVDSAAPGRVVVISFYPHPGVVLGRAESIPLITPLRLKCSLLSEMGVTDLILLRFTPRLAKLSAAEFLDYYLLKVLRVTHAVLGPDTALGRNREGGREFIEQHLRKAGVIVESVPFREDLGARISSRRIRQLIEQGEVEQAGQLLGRSYTLIGRVIKGDSRGRLLGSPTANIAPGSQIMPGNGVYASVVRVTQGGQFPAVTNIGVRPTFGAHGVSVESHLLGFTGDLYGQRIEVGLVAKIRDERRFASAAELSAQIKMDISRAKEILKL